MAGRPAISFARVAVARPVHTTFHYRIPEPLEPWAVSGARCVVPFGATRVTGFIVGVEPEAQVARTRDILEVLDREPVLPLGLVELGLWMAGYYHHPPGQALMAMIPPRYRARVEPVYRIAGPRPEGGGRPSELWDRMEAAGETPVSALGAGDFDPLATLLTMGVVRRGWAVASAPALKGTTWFGLAPGAPEPQAVLTRAPRQASVLEALAGGPLPGPVLRSKGAGTEVLRRLVAKGWVTRREEGPRAEPLRGVGDPGAALELTSAQAAALGQVAEGFDAGAFRTVLLQGVTGSGKTEVYLRAVAQARARGRSALVLVPEISLTSHVLARFLSRFGGDVAVLHSGLGARERALQWERVRRGEAQIVLGVRSAVLAPLTRLGVVVVDEEHDGAYKQEDGFRYHGKHTALVRARRDGAVAVLGSATPDVETWWAARSNRFVHVRLPERVGGARPPEVHVVDLRQEDARGRRRTVLSAPLRKAVARALERGEQALLFLNRRGFSPALVCESCGEAARCTRCSVALTLHREGGRETLRCHYCGAGHRAPRSCPACGGPGLGAAGVGTQRLVELAGAAWPDARVLRLDRDTVRRAGGRAVLEAFHEGDADVLVGTQMVAKGHHFPRLTVVGVVDADAALHFPDFRAGERTFQTLTQVTGRAGRESRPGHAYIQTRMPDHPVIRAAVEGDFDTFAVDEIEARREAGYPPFRRLVLVRVSSPDPDEAEAGARSVAEAALARAEANGVDVLGPAPAPIERVRGRWRYQVLLRGPGPEPGPVQQVVMGLRRDLAQIAHRDLRVGFDVDPVSML